jgi:hypothetical protein
VIETLAMEKSMVTKKVAIETLAMENFVVTKNGGD